jgi:tetratricopeptide (TPR) repeat protein
MRRWTGMGIAALAIALACQAGAGELAERLAGTAAKQGLPVLRVRELQGLVGKLAQLDDPRVAELAGAFPALAARALRSARADLLDGSRPLVLALLDPRRSAGSYAYAAAVRDPAAFLAGVGPGRAESEDVLALIPDDGGPPLYATVLEDEVLVSPDRELLLDALGGPRETPRGFRQDEDVLLSVPASELLAQHRTLLEPLRSLNRLQDLGRFEEIGHQLRRLDVALGLDSRLDLVAYAELLPLRGSILARHINLGGPLCEPPLPDVLPSLLGLLELPEQEAHFEARADGFVWEIDVRYPLGAVLARREVRRRAWFEAREHERRGLDALRKDDLDAATQELTEAIRLLPGSPRLLANRGFAYFRGSRFEEAVSDLSAAIRLRPDEASWYGLRGSAYSRLGRFEEAVSDLTEAIRLEPGEALHYARRAMARAGQNKTAEALEDFGRAIEIRPAEPQYRVGRAAFLENVGRLDEAILDYTKAIDLHPNEASLYRFRAEAHSKEKHYDLALADLDLAVELEPGKPSLYQARGWVHAKLQDERLALKDYDKAIELDPMRPDPYMARGLLHYEIGHHDQAVADYTRLLELDPNNAAAYNNRALSLSHNGRFEEALADVNKAIAMSPQGAYFDTRGTVYLERGLYDPALTEYNRAVSLLPDTAEVYYNRGRAYLKKGLVELAQADYAKAVELDPSYADRPYGS